MPTKTLLLSLSHVVDRHQLEDALSVLYARNLLSRPQWHVICMAAAPALPGAVEVRQRTPKGMTYVTAGASSFRVNVRSKLIRVYP